MRSPLPPMLSLAAAIALFPAATGTPSAWGQAHQKDDFNIHLYGPFLEPAPDAAAAEPGDEMQAGDISWSSPDHAHGRVAVAMWGKKAVVDFDTTPDKRDVSALSVDLGNQGRPGQSGEDVWRHRHVYVKLPNGNYVWNSLGDERPPMDASVGADYDRVLMGLWRFWARKLVQQRLAGAPANPPPAAAAELNKPMTMSYDSKGLVGTATGEFVIRLWRVPVRVRFEIEPAQPTEFNPWIIGLSRLSFPYDTEDEWRRRHGYSRLSSGDYAWDPDFNEPKPDIASFGPKMDDLMVRCASYWSEAAVLSAMDRLDKQLKEAMAALQPAVAAAPSRPALLTLARLEAQGWAR